MRRLSAICIAALIAVLGFASVAASSCRDMDVARSFIPPAYAATVDATIEYFGHNFFQITTSKGTRIVTDPLAPGMYPTPRLTAHAVTVGREHPNHNYVQIVGGNPIILRGLAHLGAEWNRVSMNVRDVFIYNVPIYQNGLDGAVKGAAFMFDLGSLCIAHLGDLAHTLTPEQLKQMGRIDVALIPIGGVFTMPPRTAREVLQQIKPKIAIPMHYRDNFYILAPFVQGLPTRRPEPSNILTVSKSALPATTEIVVLRPVGGTDYW